MSLTSWAKKELSKIKFHSPRRLLPPPPTSSNTSDQKSIVPSPRSQISEVVLDADLRCVNCRERVADTISSINSDLESIVVHVAEKKVTLTRMSTNH